MIIQVNPLIDHSVRNLCAKPYPGHPKGCPNFNHKYGCPPGAQLFDNVFDISKPVFAIYNQFDLKSHIERMREANPEWSKAQLSCCLYWQNTARKQLSKEVLKFIYHDELYGRCHVAMAPYKGIIGDLKNWTHRIIQSPPEAMGVNITETMKNAGIILEWPPETVTYQIALAGIKK